MNLSFSMNSWGYSLQTTLYATLSLDNELHERVCSFGVVIVEKVGHISLPNHTWDLLLIRLIQLFRRDIFSRLFSYILFREPIQSCSRDLIHPSMNTFVYKRIFLVSARPVRKYVRLCAVEAHSNLNSCSFLCFDLYLYPTQFLLRKSKVWKRLLSESEWESWTNCGWKCLGPMKVIISLCSLSICYYCCCRCCCCYIHVLICTCIYSRMQMYNGTCIFNSPQSAHSLWSWYITLKLGTH